MNLKDMAGSTSDIIQLNMPKKHLYSLIVLTICSLSISFGIWNTSLPLGDEAGYISTAKGLVSEGGCTSNLYILTYSLILRFPVSAASAHYICRFGTSLVSAILIFCLITTCLRRVNRFVALGVCIFWMNCSLNNPYVQYGNINLFTLNIAILPVIFLIRRPSLGRFIFTLTCFVLCALIKSEYCTAVFLLGLYMAYLYYGEIGHIDKAKIFLSIRRSSYALLFMIISGVMILCDRSPVRSYDKYLLQAFSQCYTYQYSRMNPDIRIDPMQEYHLIIDEVFDHPTGFVDAALKNPAEIIRYFFLNGAINCLLLVPSLCQHRAIFPFRKIPEIFHILLVIAVPLLASLYYLKVLLAGLKPDAMASFLRMQVSEIYERIGLRKLLIRRIDISLLMILSAVPIVSILLLMPDPRYWVSSAPLVLTWIAWGYSYYFTKISSFRIQLIIFMLFAGYMSRPMFLGLKSNKAVLDAIIQASGSSKTAEGEGRRSHVIAGLNAFGTYAFDKYETVGLNDLNPEMFKNGQIDFLVIDRYQRRSRFWDENRQFMDEFENDPQKWGYRRLEAENYDGIVAYSKKEFQIPKPMGQ